MSREIKFDAIYKPTREHFEPTSIAFIQNRVVGNFDGTIGNWCHFSLDGKSGDAILRQYVGCKDDKGTEIYVGDIVGVAYFVHKNNQYIRNTIVIKDIRRINELVHADQSIVLGNIHEHPHLLETDDPEEKERLEALFGTRVD